jgi:anti-anti-sigma regulatory factor
MAGILRLLISTTETAMAFFSKPKKPEPPKPEVRPRPASARELAAQAGAKGRRQVEPAGGDMTVTGASLAQWTPAQANFEVAQANPGLCAVLENAALRFANGQVADARKLLEEGIESDNETKLSVLAWLALFDLFQRQHDHVAFDRLALQYVMQFERSAPAWEQGDAPVSSPRVVGGSIAVTGSVTAASATQIEGLRRAVARQMHGARLDLMSMTDFDDTGARLLANALAEARRAGLGLQLLRGPKLDAALAAALNRGRAAGEGAWLLSLEFLQWANDRSVFEDRAIEFAMAFELSPPSWEPPVASAPAKAAEPEDPGMSEGLEAEMLKWSGALTGSLSPALGKLADSMHTTEVVAVDMSEVERVDFVCAGALSNLITRIESQHKSVQIVGASPIIRALLLLIGVSPRHFVKKPQ